MSGGAECRQQGKDCFNCFPPCIFPRLLPPGRVRERLENAKRESLGQTGRYEGEKGGCRQERRCGQRERTDAAKLVSFRRHRVADKQTATSRTLRKLLESSDISGGHTNTRKGSHQKRWRRWNQVDEKQGKAGGKREKKKKEAWSDLEKQISALRVTLALISQRQIEKRVFISCRSYLRRSAVSILQQYECLIWITAHDSIHDEGFMNQTWLMTCIFKKIYILLFSEGMSEVMELIDLLTCSRTLQQQRGRGDACWLKFDHPDWIIQACFNETEFTLWVSNVHEQKKTLPGLRRRLCLY